MSKGNACETHTVFKDEDVQKYLSLEEEIILGLLLEKMDKGREKDGKKKNSYWICNKDEAYSEAVRIVIQEGARRKNEHTI